LQITRQRVPREKLVLLSCEKEKYRLVALEYWLLIKILGSKGEASARKETYMRRSNVIFIVYQMLLWWSNQGRLCGQYI
jgi:hypothetical protein